MASADERYAAKLRAITEGTVAVQTYPASQPVISPASTVDERYAAKVTALVQKPPVAEEPKAEEKKPEAPAVEDPKPEPKAEEKPKRRW